MKTLFLKHITHLFTHYLPQLCNQRGEVGDLPDDVDVDDLPDDMMVDSDGNVTIRTTPADDAPPTDTPPDDDAGKITVKDGDTPPADDGQRTPTDDADDDTPVSRAEYRKVLAELETLKSSGPAKAPGTGDGTGDEPGNNAPPPTPVTPWDKARTVKVEYDNDQHPYHGLTLGQIYDLNPNEAYRIDPLRTNQIVYGEMHAVELESTRKTNSEREALAQIEREKTDFTSEFAKEHFNTDANALTPAQRADVDKMAEQVVQWMTENNKVGITISEAYYLMDRAGHAARIVQKVISAASRNNVHTISTKPDGKAKGNAQDADMAKWSDDKLYDHLNTLSTSKQAEFFRTAPAAVRAKFPDLPWE